MQGKDQGNDPERRRLAASAEMEGLRENGVKLTSHRNIQYRF